MIAPYINIILLLIAPVCVFNAGYNWEKIDSTKNEAKTVSLNDGTTFDVYFVDLETSDIAFYHKTNTGEKIKNIRNLAAYQKSQSKKLLFATNGGMYRPDHSPTGLYVEAGITHYPLNLEKGGVEFTNFYHLNPNGVFYLQSNGGYGIVPKEKYATITDVQYATQSSPMLLIDGGINQELNPKSTSKFIRSGVGIARHPKILNRYELIFAISKKPVTFYDFARIFLYYGCEEALYLDGNISEMYLPELQRMATYNDFASLIAVTEKI